MMRTLKTLAASPASLAVLLLGLGGAAGCDKYTSLKDVPVDCTADVGYEFLTLSSYETVGDNVFWSSGDATPGKVVGDDAAGDVFVEDIPDSLGGPRCGSKAAAVLRASGNNDWGCLFGSNNVGAPRDASAYEGLSLWARDPGNTTKGFVIALDDENTALISNIGNCKNYVPSTNAGQGTIPVTIDGQTVAVSSATTRAAYPDECGNSYSAVMLATSEWAFYTIPFGSFQQDPKPNRVPNAVLTQVGKAPGTALLTNQIMNLMIRMPKEANEQLWIDNLAFYRKKAM